MMTYAQFYQILTEAESRVKNHPDAAVRANSQETVALCRERMKRDGLTRNQLRKDYQVARRQGLI